jgi:hypothetical protein
MTTTTDMSKAERIMAVLVHQGYHTVLHSARGANDLRINREQFYVAIWGDEKYQLQALEKAYRLITGHDYSLSDYREIVDE